MKLRSVLGSVAFAGALAISPGVAAAQPRPIAPPRSPAPPPVAPKSGMQAALIDLTGNWVSVIDEDWRFRMMTPPKGDYLEVPLNAAARRIADQFNPALYGGAHYQLSAIIDCRAYGVAGLMHMPMRLQIGWASPNELKIQTDWGEQTRLLHFIPGHPSEDTPYEDLQQTVVMDDAAANSGKTASMQGYSTAAWEQPYQIGSLAHQRGPVNGRLRAFALYRSHINDAQPGGSLLVVTTGLKPGWLRRNGVPYGSHARVVEHYLTFQDPTGRKWFDVTTEVIDPEYLTAAFRTTSNFQQEPDSSQWAPHPCRQVAE
jgi:hypothetical protein